MNTTTRRRDNLTASAWPDTIRVRIDGDAARFTDNPCDTFDLHLHRLGPTATLTWLWIARRSLIAGGPVDVELLHCAAWCGVSLRQAKVAMGRLVWLRYAERHGDDTVVLRVA